VLGTARYLSPEGARGDPVGQPADVYSIATMLFECLAGRTPFDAESAVALLVRRTQDTAMDVRSTPNGAHVPEALATLLASSLARDVSRRPRDARELGRQLFLAATTSGLAPRELLPRSTLLGTRSAELPVALVGRTVETAPLEHKPLEHKPLEHKPLEHKKQGSQRFARIALVAGCFALGALGALGIATNLGSCERGAP
jgi:serine/threonine protein kinase